jgi:hypothetical protein
LVRLPKAFGAQTSLLWKRLVDIAFRLGGIAGRPIMARLGGVFSSVGTSIFYVQPE